MYNVIALRDLYLHIDSYTYACLHNMPIYIVRAEATEGIIERCYSTDTPQETLKRLKQLSAVKGQSLATKQFLLKAIFHMERLNPTLLETWYELTGKAVGATINQSLELEMKLALALGSSTELKAQPLNDASRAELAAIENMELGADDESTVDFTTAPYIANKRMTAT